MLSKNIHPFPARMAPEIALTVISKLPPKSIILDPMMGSGTVLKTASKYGHYGIGIDVDPLSVLLTKVWTTPINPKRFHESAQEIVRLANNLKLNEVFLPWQDEDAETRDFINFWFAIKQRNALRKLSFLINKKKGAIGNALRLCISRLIITKKRGASLAGDVSHSRPHRIRKNNDFNVFEEFIKISNRLSKRFELDPPKGTTSAFLGDGRRLKNIDDCSIDAIITSPPYLNAIDYLRGHRLSLVWLGYKISELCNIRRNSIGAERMLESKYVNEEIFASLKKIKNISRLSKRQYGMLCRYAHDINSILTEAKRVIKPGGKAIFVVGNSFLTGTHIKNTSILKNFAKKKEFVLIEEYQRKLPPNKRYLPPPNKNEKSALSSRMRIEAVLTFRNPKN